MKWTIWGLFAIDRVSPVFVLFLSGDRMMSDRAPAIPRLGIGLQLCGAGYG